MAKNKVKKANHIKLLLKKIQKVHEKSFKKTGISRKAKISISKHEKLLTANRLFMKNELKRIRKHCKKLVIALLRGTSKFQKVPYKKSTLGHFLLGIAESLMDDLELLDFTSQHLDKNPLGILDGYGSTILLPRETVTKDLGFKKIQINSLYCRHSSAKFTTLYLHTLNQIAESLRRLKMDKKSHFKKISLSYSIQKAGSITGENLQLAKNILKKNSPSEIPASLDPKFKSFISLGAAGNLDIHHYRNRLQRL